MDDPVVAFRGNSPPSWKAQDLSPGNQGQNLLCKCNDNAACHGENPVGPLAGVMRFQRKANLQNAEAQQDQTNGTNQAENKVWKDY